MSEKNRLKTAAELRESARKRQQKADEKKRQAGLVRVSFWIDAEDAKAIKEQLKRRDQFTEIRLAGKSKDTADLKII